MALSHRARWTALSLGSFLFLAGCSDGPDTSAGQDTLDGSPTSQATETVTTSDLTVSVAQHEHSDADIHTVSVNHEDSDEAPPTYDMDVQRAVDDALQDLREQDSDPQQPLLVLNPYGTNTTSLLIRFAAEEDGQLEYTVSSAGHEDFTRTAKDHHEDPGIFESQIVGLVPGAQNTLTTTWRPQDGEPVEHTITLTAPSSEAGYTTQIERDVQGDPEQLTDGLFLLSGSYQAGPYGFLFDNAGTMRAEVPIEGHMLDRFEMYQDSLVYPVGDHTLTRVDGLGRVMEVYDLGPYEMHHDFQLTDDGHALILATDTSRDSVEDILLTLDLESGEYRELVDFAELLKGYKDLTNPYEAPDSDGSIIDDWLHLNSIDYDENDDSVIVSGRENSTIIKVGGVHENPEVDYLIGTDELWEGSGHEDALLTKVGDFSDTGGQHTVFRQEDDSLEDGQHLLTMFDNSYWRVLSREDYTGPVPEDASDIFGTDPEEDSFVRTYLVDENEGTYTEVNNLTVPYSGVVSSAHRVGSNTVVNSGQAFVLSEHDENDQVIASYSYDGENYTYRGMKYSFDDFWYVT